MMEYRVTKTQFLLTSAFLTTGTKAIKSQSNSYNFLLAETDRIGLKKNPTSNNKQYYEVACKKFKSK